MEIQHIPILTNTIIAISAVFGVIGASAFYLQQIGNFSTGIILQSILFYILFTVSVTLIMIRFMKKWPTKKPLTG